MVHDNYVLILVRALTFDVLSTKVPVSGAFISLIFGRRSVDLSQVRLVNISAIRPGGHSPDVEERIKHSFTLTKHLHKKVFFL